MPAASSRRLEKQISVDGQERRLIKNEARNSGTNACAFAAVGRTAGEIALIEIIKRNANRNIIPGRGGVGPSSENTTFGHGARHLQGTGLSQGTVESTINQQIQSLGSQAGSHWGWAQVEGQWLQYRAFVLPKGTVNVGTYFPVAGNLSN